MLHTLRYAGLKVHSCHLIHYKDNAALYYMYLLFTKSFYSTLVNSVSGKVEIRSKELNIE